MKGFPVLAGANPSCHFLQPGEENHYEPNPGVADPRAKTALSHRLLLAKKTPCLPSLRKGGCHLTDVDLPGLPPIWILVGEPRVRSTGSRSSTFVEGETGLFSTACIHCVQGRGFDRGIYGAAGSRCGSSASDGAKEERWSPAHHHWCDDTSHIATSDGLQPRPGRLVQYRGPAALLREGGWRSCVPFSRLLTTPPTSFPSPASQSLVCDAQGDQQDINPGGVARTDLAATPAPRSLVFHAGAQPTPGLRQALDRLRCTVAWCSVLLFSPAGDRCAGRAAAYFWDGTGRPHASTKRPQGVRCLAAPASPVSPCQGPK
jgi:hypothetical protein